MPNDTFAGQPLQVVVFVGTERQVVDLPARGTLSIGRGEECSLRIQDPSVSRRHALLHVRPRLVIEDLGSANGTMIRDRCGTAADADTLSMRRVRGREADLSIGDVLLLGAAHVVVRRMPVANTSVLRLTAEEVVLCDPAMRAIYAEATLAASARIHVLLLGETGVGKEVLARVIHSRSARAESPFLAINCAALNDSLLESELFGHERGAFTGAQQTRIGLFEAASGGTVLLDEVGELSPSCQAKLLRVIEGRAVTRLGSSRSRAIDVRFLAASNRDLEADCVSGRFRRDLYFRLNGLTLWIPPLRQRPLDVEQLARELLADACRSIERAEIPRISPEAFDCLHAHCWPGNIRELKNAMERAAILCRGDTILPEHLPVSVEKGSALASVTPMPSGVVPAMSSHQRDLDAHPPTTDLPTQIRAIERARIMEALLQCGGVQSEAARMLGISRGTLISRIKEYGVALPPKRNGLRSA